MLNIADKIVVKTSSGLGNQLFQLANGLEQSRRLSASLLCDRSENDGILDRQYALSRLERICGFESTSNLEKTPDIYVIRKYQEKLEFQFDQDINKISVGTLVSGYFQHPEYSSNSIPMLLQALASLNSFNDDSDSIHLHVRRGDINRNPYLRKKFGVLDIRYYTDAIDYLGLGMANSRQFKIFSDSPEEALKLFRKAFKNQEVVLGKLHSDPLSNLLELSNTSILIGANSTFSWWAARLMESVNSEAKVVFPKGMLRSILESKILVQPNWTSIKPTWK